MPSNQKPFWTTSTHPLFTQPVSAGTTMPYDKGASPRAELFREYKNLACTGDIGPAAVELGDQRFQRIAAHRPIERGLIGELVTGLMQGGIAHAPEPPRLLDAECFCRVGQMFPIIPFIERHAF